MRIASIIVAFALSATPAFAQHVGISGSSPSQWHGGFAFAGSRQSGHIGISGAPLRDRNHHRRFGREPLFYSGWPYWPADYDEPYEPETTGEPPAPQVVTVPQPKPEPVEPAMYELRDNHWVRVNFGEATASLNTSAEPTLTQAATKELPPAILVFRDGHTEQINSYSIIGTTLYAKSDYWKSGEWTRKIEIANLNVPATIQANRDHGLTFDLPSSPDEVILRP